MNSNGMWVSQQSYGEMAGTNSKPALGKANLEHDVPVGPETRFGIASITKLYTAATLLRLHHRNEIDLESVVQNYVPEFPVKPRGDITIRMLATHRSGIPHPRDRTPKLFATH